MQIKFFTLPVFDYGQVEEELNKFLRSHRILQTERHFCPDNGGYWAILVEYMDGDPTAESPVAYRKEKKDFSEGMSEEEKLRFIISLPFMTQRNVSFVQPLFLIGLFFML